MGKLIAFINYMTQMSSSLLMISSVFTMFVRARASTERIGEVMNVSENTQAVQNDVNLDNLDTIKFRNVSFSYSGNLDEPVLKEINFECHTGETIGIIGTTGSGKTSLISLIPRFYEATAGKVFVGGVDVGQIDEHELRDKIAIVPQKNTLFTGTILENIRWGNAEATIEEASQAAKIAQAHEFIISMPEGYETILGQGGVNLSGGQKQRLSIARALVKKPDILILDDCTSAVDVITEAKIKNGLKTYSDKLICLIIAQRISSVITADKILVLDNGFLVGSGSHADLLQNCEIYREIYESQFGKVGRLNAGRQRNTGSPEFYIDASSGPRWISRGMPVEKPKNFRYTIKRLWSFFGHEKLLLILIFAFVIIDSVILLTVPYLTGKAVNLMVGGKNKVNFEGLRSIIFMLLAVFLCDMLLSLANNLLMAGSSQRIVRQLRKSLFSKLQKLPISFYDTRSHGDLMSRFTNDIDNISTTLSQSTVSLMSDVVSIAGSFVMMMILNPLLACASMITVPLVLLLSNTVVKRTRVLFKQQQNVLGRLNGHIRKVFLACRLSKHLIMKRKVINEFDDINSALLKVGTKAQITSGYLMPMMNIISNIGFAVIAGAGGVLAVFNIVTIGVIASFLSYSKQFSRPLNDVANIFNTLQTGVAGAERIFEILDCIDEIRIEMMLLSLSSHGEVEFKDVMFEYRKGVTILKDISFKADAGSTTALVGPTGAGKTTVVSLINRFYDVTEGQILIDATDIKDYTRESLRRCFGIVLQDSYLFSGTIKENIRYGRINASDDEVRQAAVEACADVFIRKLEKGYDTLLSESGGNLSQGQRQLLAIARAILADPSILILDEATSSVDTRTEMNIQKAMVSLMNGRTCFIIAHRLSTIRGADIIMVIDNGQIVESGSHEVCLCKRVFIISL